MTVGRGSGDAKGDKDKQKRSKGDSGFSNFVFLHRYSNGIKSNTSPSEKSKINPSKHSENIP